jgi:hypothetical protein
MIVKDLTTIAKDRGMPGTLHREDRRDRRSVQTGSRGNRLDRDLG